MTSYTQVIFTVTSKETARRLKPVECHDNHHPGGCMMYRAVLACITALAAALLMSRSHAAAHADPTQVRVASGAVQGAQADGVVSFKGIPYAAPPIDELRWRPPQPVKPWNGVRPSKD